jgi:hypothetical protein
MGGPYAKGEAKINGGSKYDTSRSKTTTIEAAALEEQITELSQGVLELQRDKAKAKIAEKKQEYAAPQVKAKTKGKATK